MVLVLSDLFFLSVHIIKISEKVRDIMTKIFL